MHLGDVLLLGPLISCLKARDPACRISVLVKEETRTMLEGHPHVDEVISIPKRLPTETKTVWIMRHIRWWRDLRARRFDWTINTTKGDRGVIAGFLSGARRRSGWSTVKGEKFWRKPLITDPVVKTPGRRHMVIRNLDTVAGLRGDDGCRQVRMAFSDADAAMVDAALTAGGWDGKKMLVQVHPTSRWMFKCWTDQGMAEAIDHIQERGFQVVVTAGPAQRELEKNRAILALCRSRPIDLGGRLSLKALAALTARCSLFFGIDTAPMHMAAAMGIPVVALFGPSAAFIWGPWPNGWQGEDTPYPKQCGVQTAGSHITIQMELDCVPCAGDGCDGSKKSDCLDNLTFEKVLPHLSQALNRCG